MKRRTLLGAASALALPAAAAERVALPLRVAARRSGLLIGSSSEIDLSRDPAYAALLAANVDLFAPNMSWQRMSPQPGETAVALDPNVAWAQAAGLRLTGYHLLWHQRLPGWFAGLDRTAAERAIVAHIEFMGARFGAETDSWNVVNEAIRPADGRPGGLRRSPLLEILGPAFFDLAFETARQMRPDVLRVYNDYDLELNSPDQRARQRALLGLLDRFAARGVPIQAVGLQCHLRTRSFDAFDPVAFRRFLDEIAARGLAIVISELDVHDLAPGDVAARDRQVASILARFLEAALGSPHVRALVFWGLSDGYSWLNDPARPQDARPDGQPGRPAPFDAEMRPTAAWEAVQQALAAAPARSR